MSFSKSSNQNRSYLRRVDWRRDRKWPASASASTARRARTREGQLQVELAQLKYLLPRLTGRGAAMSRLGGGIGTPARAADYLTGRWSQQHGFPLMPVDGILVGTAAMAAPPASRI